MRTASVFLLLLLMTVVTASEETTLPGRDGAYQFEAQSLEGTVWEGRMIPEAVMLVRFERNGVLCYRYANHVGPGLRTGSWRQTGNSVYIETNKKYAEYRAVLTGDRLIGDAKNVVPHQWKWEMKRQPATIVDELPK